MTPLLVVGLGNPGQGYEHTRHNLGFRVLNAVVSAVDWKREADVEVASHVLDSRRIFFIKPQTFMNESGRVVQRFVSFYKIPLAHVLVVHDDLDLPFGELRPAFDRGAAGHNGVADIISKISSSAFHRLRIGIGSNRESQLPAEDYVLQSFLESEEALLEGQDGIIAKASGQIRDWIRTSQ